LTKTNNVNGVCLKEFHKESAYCKVQRWFVWLRAHKAAIHLLSISFEEQQKSRRASLIYCVVLCLRINSALYLAWYKYWQWQTKFENGGPIRIYCKHYNRKRDSYSLSKKN